MYTPVGEKPRWYVVRDSALYGIVFLLYTSPSIMREIKGYEATPGYVGTQSRQFWIEETPWGTKDKRYMWMRLFDKHIPGPETQFCLWWNNNDAAQCPTWNERMIGWIYSGTVKDPSRPGSEIYPQDIVSTFINSLNKSGPRRRYTFTAA